MAISRQNTCSWLSHFLYLWALIILPIFISTQLWALAPTSMMQKKLDRRHIQQQMVQHQVAFANVFSTDDSGLISLKNRLNQWKQKVLEYSQAQLELTESHVFSRCRVLYSFDGVILCQWLSPIRS